MGIKNFTKFTIAFQLPHVWVQMYSYKKCLWTGVDEVFRASITADVQRVIDSIVVIKPIVVMEPFLVIKIVVSSIRLYFIRLGHCLGYGCIV